MIGLFDKNGLVTIVNDLDINENTTCGKDDKGQLLHIVVVRARYVPWELRRNFIDYGEMAISKKQTYNGKELEAKSLSVL